MDARLAETQLGQVFGLLLAVQESDLFLDGRADHETGDVVADPHGSWISFRQARLVNAKTGPIKILGSGELTKSLDVTADRFSESAKKKIEAAGGKAVTG